MNKKAIKNSPGYYITDDGKVYNENNRLMKTWFSVDGYERVRLTSIIHGKRVNRTVHLLVAAEFLDGGKYTADGRQVNHIDGVKSNNHVTNLELVSPTENVNHAHGLGLYTYNINITMKNIETNETKIFRSLRESARYLKVSLNYIKPRLIISTRYPIRGKYVFIIDYLKYLNYVSGIRNEKTIYVYSHIAKKHYLLTAYSQISILFGISYINVGKKLSKNPGTQYYVGGYTFSLKKITSITTSVTQDKAITDREYLWKKIAMNVTT